MAKWQGLNKRQFPRIKYPCLIVIRNDKDKDHSNTVLTHTENVGVGGVCVSLKQSLKVYSMLNIELDLLDLSDHIRCSGKVIWNIEKEDDKKENARVFDIGIEFLDIQDNDQERLKEVIERLADTQK